MLVELKMCVTSSSKLNDAKFELQTNFFCRYAPRYLLSAVWTQSPDSTDLGIKGSKYTHIQPNFVTDT